MSVEQNRKLAREFFECFNANDVAGALARMSEDSTWWIAGKPGAHPAAGTKTKPEIARLFKSMGGQLKDGLRMKIKSALAEGDRVAIEVESHGELQNGRVYDQQYHM